jgi:hypothetical protein
MSRTLLRLMPSIFVQMDVHSVGARGGVGGGGDAAPFSCALFIAVESVLTHLTHLGSVGGVWGMVSSAVVEFRSNKLSLCLSFPPTP